jgi:hypothetical protein
MAKRTSLSGRALTGLAALTLLLTACGGGDGGGDGGGAAASARPAQEQITVTSADADTPFNLQPGRYKFGWDASECASVNFTMTGATQGFVYDKKTLQKRFSAIVSDVPEDTYTIAQIDPACTTWSVQIDKIGS